jgi:predicted ABC-type transport system involved in lysophospholipase L1 biosynthesis ATPase subunit
MGVELLIDGTLFKIQLSISMNSKAPHDVRQLAAQLDCSCGVSVARAWHVDGHISGGMKHRVAVARASPGFMPAKASVT